MSKMLDQFCRALAEETGTRSNWWVSIHKLADRLDLDVDRATVLADECEKAGYIQHDQSQSTRPERAKATPLHSVTLMPGGRARLAPSKRRAKTSTAKRRTGGQVG